MFYPLPRKIFLIAMTSFLFSWQVLGAMDAKKSFEDNCSGCHSIGGGNIVGPDLKDVLKRRQRDWVIHYVQEPDELRNKKDTTALELKKQFGDSEMPNLGLGHEEVEAIVDFLAQSEGDAGLAAPLATPPASQGDAIRGNSLFSGTTKFASGAPACISCHSVTFPDMPMGGTLGPNLTTSVARLGATAILNALKNSPFPTMKPIYKTRPLSEEEQNDVAAFLLVVSSKNANGQATPHNYFLFAGLALSAAVLVIFNLIWRGRLRGVRKSLVKKGVE